MRRIALFTPSKYTYSETFIQLHIDGLNHVNWVYHDGEQPTKCNDVSFPPLSKWTIRFLNWRYNRKWGWEQWSLFQSLKMNQPDVVYFEYGTTAVANIEVVELLNIATITNFHGFDISVFDILKKNQERYRNLFLNTNNRFVVVSKKMLNRIVEMGAREKSILYSPCGANMEYQKIVPNLNSKQFVMLGRLVEKKSPLSSIKAFYQVYQKDKEVRLAIIGNGPLMSNCEEFVQQNNLTDVVVFHGNVEGHEKGGLQSVALLSRGEGVRVERNRRTSRIVSVNGSEEAGGWSAVGSFRGEALITAVGDSMSADEEEAQKWPSLRNFYRIVPGGLRERARAFSDTQDEWTSVPEELVGADQVRTFAVDRYNWWMQLTLEISRPCELYIFVDQRNSVPRWVADTFSDTGKTITLNFMPFTGSGRVAAQYPFSIWSRRVDKPGTIALGPPYENPPDDRKSFKPNSMFGVVAREVP